MITASTKIIDHFFDALKSAARPLLLLDYDGTLAPFRVDRFTAVPWPGVREVLNEIQQNGRTRIAVVTGRPAAEIAPLLSLNEPVEVWGLHGFERMHADGSRELQLIEARTQQVLDDLHAALRADSFGGLFEEKPNAAVMHWRGLTEKDAHEVEHRTRALFEPAANQHGFRLLPFEFGVELRVGRDKGDAVTEIMQECEGCTPVAFLGDDLTDESAFQAVKRHGLSALVRPEYRATCADAWLKPPAELLQFLRRWRDTEVEKIRN